MSKHKIVSLHYTYNSKLPVSHLADYEIRRYKDSDDITPLLTSYYNKYKALNYDLGTLEHYISAQVDTFREHSNVDSVLCKDGKPVCLVSYSALSEQEVSAIRLYNYMSSPDLPISIQRAFIEQIVASLSQYTSHVFTDSLAEDKQKITLFTEVGFTEYKAGSNNE